MNVILQHCSVFRGKREILQDLNTELRAGTLTVLLGKNGCGKSTLISALVGALPFRGTVWLDDLELRALSAKERAKRIAVVPQLPKQVDASVEELVAFGRLPHHALGETADTRDRDAIESAIAAMELQGLRTANANRISGGELCRAYFAMALAQDTPVLLLDEPTAHTDEENKANILQALRKLTQDQGKTVLAVMHDVADAVTYADRLILLRDGKIAAQGSTQEVLDGQQIEQIFGLRRTTGDVWKWRGSF